MIGSTIKLSSGEMAIEYVIKKAMKHAGNSYFTLAMLGVDLRLLSGTEVFIPSTDEYGRILYIEEDRRNEISYVSVENLHIKPKRADYLYAIVDSSKTFSVDRVMRAIDRLKSLQPLKQLIRKHAPWKF